MPRPSPVRPALVVAVLVAPGALAPTASAAPAPALRASALGSGPARATQGSGFTVPLRLRATSRRTQRARVTLSLRTSPRSPTAHVLGTTTVRLTRGASRVVTLPAQVRRTLTPGTYALVACARVGRGRRACVTARGRTVVVARALPGAPAPVPVPAPSAPPVTVTTTVTAEAPAAPLPPQTTPPPSPEAPTPGARTGGDDLFPQIGNGGYDATHYDLDLGYTPTGNTMDSTATMTATATQALSELSLDLEGFEVTAVRVDGAPATFTREATKLVVTPATPIADGASFAVAVDYAGTPSIVTDPDGSSEGWFPTDDGAIVVGEPIGAQGWFPSDNAPDDKATYDISVTVPDGITALGNGELISQDVADGRRTWHWREGHPMATYLATATVGVFDLTVGQGADGTPSYTAVDPAGFAALTQPRKDAFTAGVARQADVIRSDAFLYGPYPFSSFGGIYDQAPGLGYALESQTKPNYASVSTGAMPHELSHQWFGDSVTPGQWRDIWLNEGFATWTGSWNSPYVAGLSTESTADHFDEIYATPADDDLWLVPPADPTAEEIFDAATYDRGAAALEGYRQIVGDATFYATLRAWVSEHAYANASTEDWIALTERVSGRDLGAYWQDWLYESGKPSILPTDVR